MERAKLLLRTEVEKLKIINNKEEIENKLKSFNLKSKDSSMDKKYL